MNQRPPHQEKPPQPAWKAFIVEQLDNVRDLPGATGVIDIAGFLRALQSIGYDGPVTPEPFKKELAALPSDEVRLKKVGAAMDDVFVKAGLR